MERIIGFEAPQRQGQRGVFDVRPHDVDAKKIYG